MKFKEFGVKIETKCTNLTRPSALGMSDPMVEPLEIMGTQES